MKGKSIFSKIDKPLLFMALLYSAIGVLLVLSASSVSAVLRNGESPYYFFIKQSVFVVVSYLIGFIIILKVPTKAYKALVPIGLAIIIGLLVFLLLYGSVVNNVKSWIDLGFFSIQPSEFAKTILIIYMGVFFGEYDKRKNKKYDFLIPISVGILIFGLTAAQPDLGTALIIAGIVFFTFLSIPLKNNTVAKALKILAGGVLVAAIVFLVTGTSFLTEEQQSRLNFKAPCTRYVEKTGYQVCNGFIAINGGGLFGKGLGNSTQKYLYLPEAHTDFIFPIAVEELGVVFGVLMILGYIFILYRIVLISKTSYNLRNSIICYGAAIYILLHLIVNFCGILALIPLTGVPVPFLSYGGSFTSNLIFAIFIVERVAIENKITKRKLELSKI